MRRKKRLNRPLRLDPIHRSAVVAKFVNYVMKKGKRSLAQKIVWQALDFVKQQGKMEDPPAVLEQAITNASPLMEVKARRIGGATYQVPQEVRPERRFFLAANWIIEAARARKGKPMSEKLAEEILSAQKNEGEAIRKRQSLHKVAEANRAFAHFGWRR